MTETNRAEVFGWRSDNDRLPSREAFREGELEDALRQAVRIIARIENERGIVSREGQDFLARARKALRGSDGH